MNASREELFEKLINKTEELGRQATPSDFRNDPAMPNPNDYPFHFGSFDNAAKEAYQKVHSRELKRGVTLKKAVKPVYNPPYQNINHTTYFGRPHN